MLSVHNGVIFSWSQIFSENNTNSCCGLIGMTQTQNQGKLESFLNLIRVVNIFLLIQLVPKRRSRYYVSTYFNVLNPTIQYVDRASVSQHGCQGCLAPTEFLDSNVWHLLILVILLHNWRINLCLEKGQVKIQVRIKPDIFPRFS